MPEMWVYVFGGVVVAILAMAIGYTLLSNMINFSQRQDALAQFSDLCSNINTVCLQELGNYLVKKYSFPMIVRVVYATEDVSNALPTVLDKIKNQEISYGRNICLQLKDEQFLRCCPEPPRQFYCRIQMPHLGVLPEHEDIFVAVNKILGRPPRRDYELLINKTSGDEVLITIG
ncbi:MAG: hypothetical protein QXK48_02770 [Candidatus Aenigmatarchaeota archaeon]